MKHEDLPKVSRSVFIEHSKKRLKTRDGRYVYNYALADLYSEWDALKVLNLPNIKAENKLYAVLDTRFLPKKLFYEFACRCAEWVLSFVESPPPSAIKAISVKRKWVTGEATDAELDDARFVLEGALGGEPCGLPKYAERAMNCVLLQTSRTGTAWTIAWLTHYDAAAASIDAPAHGLKFATKEEAIDAAYEHEADMLIDLINEQFAELTSATEPCRW